MKCDEINLASMLDRTLTPKTAKEKGFRYIEDIYNPCPALKDIFDFAENKGFRFGTPLQSDTDNYLGLYKVQKNKIK